MSPEETMIDCLLGHADLDKGVETKVGTHHLHDAREPPMDMLNILQVLITLDEFLILQKEKHCKNSK